MSYLEQLKQENTHQGALPKLTEPPFDSFGSEGKRQFSEKKAPARRVELTLATPDGNRREVVDIPAGAVDLRDRPGSFLPSGAPDLPERCPLAAGDTKAPKGCRYEAKLLARMVREEVLPLPGGRCPLARACGLGDNERI